jgi:replicative DNA helicase
MPAEQLVNRLISAESGLPGERLRKGNLEEYEWAQLHNRITDLANAPLFIDDTPAITPVQLRAKCRRLKQQHDIGLIIIDYLQLMNVEGLKSGTRTEEVSLISRSLKALAKELNVPVIALSQLSRSVETRGGIKRPLLSDLRESGAIEQDADLVSFLYRPEYYGLKEYDLDGRSTEGLVEFILAKHRNGDVGTVLLRFLAKNTKFVDYDQNFVNTASGYVDASLPDQISGDRIKMGSKLNSTLPDSGFMDPPAKAPDSGDVPF